VAAVFPHALELTAEGAPRFILAGEAPLAFDTQRLEQKLLSEPVQRYFERSGANPEVTALIRGYLRRVRAMPVVASGADADINTDLHPRDEFSRIRLDEPR
jgi:hypothetical protein